VSAMACGGCKRRQTMISAAWRRDRLAGVVKVVPAVVRDAVKPAKPEEDKPSGVREGKV
jgi:hypothetical protein